MQSNQMRIVLTRKADGDFDSHRTAFARVDVNKDRLVAHWYPFHLHGRRQERLIRQASARYMSLGPSVRPNAGLTMALTDQFLRHGTMLAP
jgi:hypothetical protein